MDKQIEVVIDGTAVAVPEETTILEAASRIGIEIPTLCHHAELSPSGACRVCIVEISRPSKNPKVSWIDSACVCPVFDGMHVNTDSAKVRRERKLILELLLARAPRAPRIVELAHHYGATADRFAAADSGESNCILCGLCVRVCNELIGANAIGTAKRGINKEITSPLMVAESLCIGCLACVNVCPTGVIQFEVEGARLRRESWGVDIEMAVCEKCGRPIGSGVQIGKIQSGTRVSSKLLSYCPECRRKESSAHKATKQYTGV